jgi:hypothetical protein
VTNAQSARQWLLRQPGFQFGEASYSFPGFQLIRMMDDDPGRIIAAVFQTS